MVTGAIDTTTTTPSGQYIASRMPVTTTIWRTLSSRKTMPNDMNRRIELRSFMIRDSNWPDCHRPWNDIGRICRRA